MKRVRRVDEQWLQTCRPTKRQEWGVRQHPGLRVRVGPREASFYYYSTEFDSRGKAKRVGYNLGRWPEMTLEKAAEAMKRLRDAGPGGRGQSGGPFGAFSKTWRRRSSPASGRASRSLRPSAPTLWRPGR